MRLRILLVRRITSLTDALVEKRGGAKTTPFAPVSRPMGVLPLVSKPPPPATLSRVVGPAVTRTGAAGPFYAPGVPSALTSAARLPTVQAKSTASFGATQEAVLSRPREVSGRAARAAPVATVAPSFQLEVATALPGRRMVARLGAVTGTTTKLPQITAVRFATLGTANEVRLPHAGKLPRKGSVRRRLWAALTSASTDACTCRAAPSSMAGPVVPVQDAPHTPVQMVRKTVASP